MHHVRNCNGLFNFNCLRITNVIIFYCGSGSLITTVLKKTHQRIKREHKKKTEEQKNVLDDSAQMTKGMFFFIPVHQNIES